jgi:putative ABC transport system ATP-binding protein
VKYVSDSEPNLNKLFNHHSEAEPHSAVMITMQRISKTYETPAGSFSALKNIDLEITPGEFVAIVGKSGSGKSTLLNMIGGIDRATSGTLTVSGTDVAKLSHNDLAAWRGRSIGFVFQFFQLLPTLTVAENVMLPMDFAGVLPPKFRRTRAGQLLDRVGVADQADKLPSALSGGQQQRVAIARALANDPPVILADEPTGNLDSETSAEIFRLFAELAGDGKTLLVVTHDPEAATSVSRRITIVDGCVA